LSSKQPLELTAGGLAATLACSPKPCGCGERALECLLEGALHLLWLRARLEHIEECPLRRSGPKSMHPAHLGIDQGSPGSMKAYSSAGASVAILAGEGEVNLAGDDICQAVEFQCTLVRDDGKVRTGLNPGCGNMPEGGARIEAKAIEASRRPLQAATLAGLAAQGITVHADRLGLRRGDVSGLPFGDSAEQLPGVMVCHLL
jgi:hypothetical protein